MAESVEKGSNFPQPIISQPSDRGDYLDGVKKSINGDNIDNLARGNDSQEKLKKLTFVEPLPAGEFVSV